METRGPIRVVKARMDENAQSDHALYLALFARVRVSSTPDPEAQSKLDAYEAWCRAEGYEAPPPKRRRSPSAVHTPVVCTVHAASTPRVPVAVAVAPQTPRVKKPSPPRAPRRGPACGDEDLKPEAWVVQANAEMRLLFLRAGGTDDM